MRLSAAQPQAEARSAPVGDDDDFLRRLERMSPGERAGAARAGSFRRLQRLAWATHYPEEVPIVNGEFEWIALGMADLD